MKSKKQKELEGKLGAAALRYVQKRLRRKSATEAEETGAKLGRLIRRVGKKRFERTKENLKLAFPDWSEEKRESTAEKVFEHFGIVSADFLRSDKLTKSEINASMEVVGLEHLDGALAGGNGALLITGHFGNWERLANWLSLNGYPLTVVARDADDEGVNGILNQMRMNSGTKVLARGNAARPILEKLRANEIVGILPDQNSKEVYIPFFGHPAGTVLGPGVLHDRTHAPVIPGFCIRLGGGKYRTVFLPPLVPDPGYETKGEGMMRAIHRTLEAIITDHPEQWLWFHDRWRSARGKGML